MPSCVPRSTEMACSSRGKEPETSLSEVEPGNHPPFLGRLEGRQPPPGSRQVRAVHAGHPPRVQPTIGGPGATERGAPGRWRVRPRARRPRPGPMRCPREGTAEAAHPRMRLRHMRDPCHGITADLLTPLIVPYPGAPGQEHLPAMVATGALAVVGLLLEIMPTVGRQRARPEPWRPQVMVRRSADVAELSVRVRLGQQSIRLSATERRAGPARGCRHRRSPGCPRWSRSARRESRSRCRSSSRSRQPPAERPPH
jgi:hypothetical protein